MSPVKCELLTDDQNPPYLVGLVSTRLRTNNKSELKLDSAEGPSYITLIPFFTSNNLIKIELRLW